MTFASSAAVAAAGLALLAAPGTAAPFDLAPYGLVQGALIFASAQAAVSFDDDLDAFDVFADDGTFVAVIDAFPSDPATAFLNLSGPVDFTGFIADYAFDTDSAAGVFFDGTAYVLALLTLPGGSAFDADAFEITGATVAFYETAVIPLPLAAPLLLAGVGALAVAGRRRG